MRNVLLLLGLTLVAAQSAVAQVGTGPKAVLSARSTFQHADGTFTLSGEVVIRVGEYEIQADRAVFKRVVE